MVVIEGMTLSGHPWIINEIGIGLVKKSAIQMKASKFDFLKSRNLGTHFKNNLDEKFLKKFRT